MRDDSPKYGIFSTPLTPAASKPSKKAPLRSTTSLLETHVASDHAVRRGRDHACNFHRKTARLLDHHATDSSDPLPPKRKIIEQQDPHSADPHTWRYVHASHPTQDDRRWAGRQLETAVSPV